jgi:hypothetical protein
MSKYFVVHPKTNKDIGFNNLAEAKRFADTLAEKSKRFIRVYQNPDGTIRYQANWFATNPAKKRTATKARNYLYDPTTGKKRFYSDVAALQRDAKQLADRLGKSIGVFIADATATKKRGK